MSVAGYFISFVKEQINNDRNVISRVFGRFEDLNPLDYRGLRSSFD